METRQYPVPYRKDPDARSLDANLFAHLKEAAN
jgi:hypothetical protein